MDKNYNNNRKLFDAIKTEMKTDKLFYELFKLFPESLFDLVKINVQGAYTFESITLKSIEKRLDGLFRRSDDSGANVFLEVQGYLDEQIYWRLFREICAYYEQTKETAPFIAIALFIDKKHDPGPSPLSANSPNRFIAANLIDCLKNLGQKAGVLTVLRPFGISTKEELYIQGKQWKEEIYSQKLSRDEIFQLIELMIYLIMEKFKDLSLEEVKDMLEITDLEETVLGKKLIEKGIEKGMEKGELIGEIKMAQRILNYPVSESKELIKKSIEELKSMLEQLTLTITSAKG